MPSATLLCRHSATLIDYYAITPPYDGHSFEASAFAIFAMPLLPPDDYFDVFALPLPFFAFGFRLTLIPRIGQMFSLYFMPIATSRQPTNLPLPRADQLK